MPSSARSQDTPRACGSISVAEYPALAHPCPRIVSDDASVLHRKAHRYAEARIMPMPGWVAWVAAVAR